MRARAELAQARQATSASCTTRDGMRIDLVDDADYSMFALGTTVLVPEASRR